MTSWCAGTVTAMRSKALVILAAINRPPSRSRSPIQNQNRREPFNIELMRRVTDRDLIDADTNDYEQASEWLTQQHRQKKATLEMSASLRRQQRGPYLAAGTLQLMVRTLRIVFTSGRERICGVRERDTSIKATSYLNGTAASC